MGGLVEAHAEARRLKEPTRWDLRPIRAASVGKTFGERGPSLFFLAWGEFPSDKGKSPTFLDSGLLTVGAY